MDRAPKYYGAWVAGTYYAPGTFLPGGWSEFVVDEIYRIPQEVRRSGSSGFMRLQFKVPYGTTHNMITDQLKDLYEQYLETVSP